MTTTICLIRHGETDWNAQKRCQGREDIDLNNSGESQAAEIAKHLRKVNWDVVISSPLKRAATTARIIAQELELELITINDKFIERDYGIASGLTFEQWKQSFPDSHIPGREDDETLKERVLDGLDEVVDKYKNILLVSHGAVINSLLKTISNGAIDIGETNIKNACINIIRYDGDMYTIDLYNSLELR